MDGDLGPAKGKDFASVLGSPLVTADAFDREGATTTAEIDGETWSEGTWRDGTHLPRDRRLHIRRKYYPSR